MDIKFYNVDGHYGNFSNFAPYPIFIDGKSWPTVEHYFQSSKFEDLLMRETIRSLSSPMKAAKTGRDRKLPLRADWENIKNDVMLQALLAKFKQHHILRSELLSTNDAILIEHTENDVYWGDGGDGKGENMLGKLLMRVREMIREINDDPHIVLPPWIAFSDIDSHDMFWRMGLGENYMYVWSRYYLNNENKVKYQELFPEPTDWEGFYQY